MESADLDRILLDHAGDPQVLFVFPTDIALNRWVDRLLRLRGGGSLAMEQFIPWDRFKNASIRSRMQDRQSIPPILRKIFVCRLLEENAALVRDRGEGEAIFKFLIPPRYARDAASFAPWLASVLPQLGSWFKKAAGKDAAEIGAGDAASGGFDREEDQDLFSLTLRYGEFLKKYRLFEPAWEKPPFEDNGRECFIFFPESLSDFSEYQDLLEAAPQVRIIRLEAMTAGKKNYRSFFYTNARSEITEAALYIRNLVEKEKVRWEDIVVGIPEGENYEPYLMREFANRNIPAVRRAGKPLSSYPAGKLFTGIQDCCAQGFAFEQVSNLLLNSHLPWRNREVIDQLIDFGIKNNCLCSWTEGGRREDPWLDAFNSLAGSREQRAQGYYREFKAALEKTAGGRSFRDIIRAYFAFRDRFLDVSQCSEEADAVLSRCVSELLSLAEIEDSFPDLKAPDPYGFFIEHLKETTYLAQEKKQGISVLPYRTAASAPFDCHITLGASQDNLSIVFSRLAFLPRMKKERLGLRDIDASQDFIAMHSLNSALPAAFFCSRQGFAGFAIPHSGLGIRGEPRLRWAEEEGQFFAPDLFAGEEAALRSDKKELPELHQVQALGFRAWMERRSLLSAEGLRRFPDPGIAELLKKTCGGGKIPVSASALEPYYYCSAKWLYERVLRLESRRMETALMAENVTGSLYHAVLDKFFKSLAGEPLERPAPKQGGAPPLPPAYSAILSSAVREVFGGLPLLPGEKTALSALTARLLRAQEQAVTRQLELLLASLLACFGGCRVAGSELSCRLEKQDYYLTGKIDLLLADEREDSENSGGVIVDFKLSKIPKRGPCIGEGERGLENFQLPMYITLAEASGAPPVRTALFFSILKNDAAVIIGSIRDQVSGKQKPGRQAILRGVGEEDKFGAIMAEFETKAEGYAADFKDGRLSVSGAGEAQCEGCPYRRVCRTLYTVGGDRSFFSGEEHLHG
ncbi:MAG: PD-(D/E)XK nuclease family protein [Treponema sp.]|nr:PD-(D/E)XK nuclease family protein [Treponema sp.]